MEKNAGIAGKFLVKEVVAEPSFNASDTFYTEFNTQLPAVSGYTPIAVCGWSVYNIAYTIFACYIHENYVFTGISMLNKQNFGQGIVRAVLKVLYVKE